jgi:cytochrome c nitrite reductase small subunit
MPGKIIKSILPPPEWRIPVIILLGIFAGMAAFTFRTSRAWSYLSDDPAACMNCHIMAPQYSTWNHSSHRGKAGCNDCHVPHNNIFNKYFFKAKDGLRHATIFTLRTEPQVIFAREASIRVIKDNCVRCHNQQMWCNQCHIKIPPDSDALFGEGEDEITMSNGEYGEYHGDRLCWECHRETPHGRVNSLSSVPNARVPVPSSAVPDWMKSGRQSAVLNH